MIDGTKGSASYKTGEKTKLSKLIFSSESDKDMYGVSKKIINFTSFVIVYIFYIIAGLLQVMPSIIKNQ